MDLYFFFFQSWPLSEFDPNQIRLIVYQDCERRGRNVLFDSSVKRKNEDMSVSVSIIIDLVESYCCIFNNSKIIRLLSSTFICQYKPSLTLRFSLFGVEGEGFAVFWSSD